MTTTPTPVDPPRLHQNPAFTLGHGRPGRTNVVRGRPERDDETGAVLHGLGPQTEQALRSAGRCSRRRAPMPIMSPSLTIYRFAVDPGAAYAATGAVWGRRRTAVTVLAVAPARARRWSRSRRWPASPLAEPDRSRERQPHHDAGVLLVTESVSATFVKPACSNSPSGADEGHGQVHVSRRCRCRRGSPRRREPRGQRARLHCAVHEVEGDAAPAEARPHRTQKDVHWGGRRRRGSWWIG